MIQNEDEWREDQQLIEQINKPDINKLNTSLFNKSCINSVNMMSLMIRQLPQLLNYNHIQRLNISNNYLKQIPMNLCSLKQLIANKNCIQKIPQEIEQMKYLRILKLNNNRITIIPFFKNVIHLQLLHNPIILISSRTLYSNIKMLAFDWIQFLVDCNNNSNDNYRQFISIMNKISNKSNLQYFTFKQLFEIHVINNLQARITELFYKAINHNYQFFINYLQSYAKQFNDTINFNKMRVMGSLLLESALQSNNQQIIKLFMMRKSNLSCDEIFWSNLELACEYSHKGLFDYIMSNSVKKLKIWQKAIWLLSKAFLNFSIIKNTDYIVQIIIKYSKMPSGKKQKIIIPQNYSIKQVENIANGLLYVLENQQLYSLLFFDQDDNQLIEQPLLHFAANTKNINLIYQLIRFNLSPFRRNIQGITPKMVKGTFVGKKTLWKIQKRLIKTSIKCHQYKQSLKQNIQDCFQFSQSALDQNRLSKNRKTKSQLIFLPYRSKIIDNTKYHILSQASLKYVQKQQDYSLSTPKNYQTNSYNIQRKIQKLNFQKQFQGIKKSIQYNQYQLYQQFHNIMNQNYQHDYNQQTVKQQCQSTKSMFKFCEDVSIQEDIIYLPRRIKHKRKMTLLAN